MSRSSQDSRIDDLVKHIRKNLKDKDGKHVARASDFEVAQQKIPTGSRGLDKVLAGGWPRGRVIELYGAEGLGKTSLALCAMRSAIQGGGVAAYVDVEHAIDFDYVKANGIDTSNYVHIEPATAEDALEAIRWCLRKGVEVIVCDTVAALASRAEMKGEIGDEHVARQARLMSKALKIMAGEVKRSRSVLFFLNQLRHNVGVMYGPTTITPGGKALKYYASTRVEMRGGKKIEDGKKIIGHWVSTKIIKSKTSVPFQVADLAVLYGKGISESLEVLALAILMKIVKVVKKKGGKGEEKEEEPVKKKGFQKKEKKRTYTFGGRIWTGAVEFLGMVAEDPTFLSSMTAAIEEVGS